MKVKLEREMKEEVQEGIEGKHEPVMPGSPLAPFSISETETSTTTEKETHDAAAEEESAIEEYSGVTLSSRRSARVSVRKLKGHWDQQVKEEPMELSPEPEAESPQTMKTPTIPDVSEGKEVVQIKQEDDRQSRRRSIRMAPKRKFADEPWS
jgi:hypothetical protein